MSLWAIAEEKRIAALAARDAYWRILERHKWRSERVDESLFEQKEAARIQMFTLDMDYNRAVQDAIESGEPHPEDSDGR
jgi:hypothetical protein